MSSRCTTINGRALSKVVCAEIRNEVFKLKKETTVHPKLAVYQIGSRQDASLYIAQKQKFAIKCGIDLSHIKLSSDCTERTLLDELSKSNDDPRIHGIMLQLPLESENKINVVRAINAVNPLKDVDGLGCVSTSILSRDEAVCMRCGCVKPAYGRAHITCTAAACLTILRSINYELCGAQCSVIGRGRLAGAPIADLLSGAGRATVTIGHRYSRDLAQIISNSDLVVAAAGSPELIDGHWIRPGAVVLDLGYNVVQDAHDPNRWRVVGDVQFSTAVTRAGWITPVPGGAGPLSIAMLFRNTLNSAKWSVNQDSGVCDCTSEVDCVRVCS